MTVGSALSRPTRRWRGARRNGLLRAAGVLLLLAPLGLALASGFPLCPSAGLFGLPCPGCGLTRATLLLLEGKPVESLAVHPLALPLAPLFFGGMAALLVDFVRGPRPARGTNSISWIQQRWVSVAAALLLLATLGLWGLRFLGCFGGPVPVESYESWLDR